jgi:hypothetical protein
MSEYTENEWVARKWATFYKTLVNEGVPEDFARDITVVAMDKLATK